MLLHNCLKQTRILPNLLLGQAAASHGVFNNLNRRGVLVASIRNEHSGLDVVREVVNKSEDEQNRCLYPMLNQLGVTTEGRNHSFNITPDSVIKFIKLGAINVNMAIQYCHYLAHLSRNAEPDDREHYTARVSNLMQYILKRNKSLPPKVKVVLLVDSASSSEATCLLVCTKLLDEEQLWSNIDTGQFSRLLSACYKFRLWESASSVLAKRGPGGLYWTSFDALITSISESLNAANFEQEEKNRMKQGLVDHLKMLFEYTREHRIQFVTKQSELLIQSLEKLMPDFFQRPVFKMSGRCTHCNTHIPLYDNKAVPEINKSIRDVLDRRHMGDLRLYSTESDINNFYKFLENLHKQDQKPIDCVIDGLNIAYKNSLGYLYSKQKMSNDFEKTIVRHDSRFQVQVLVNTIIRSNCLDKFRKILVIGKAHMNRWPGLLEFFAKNNIHFYASDNQAKDDLFMLYASTLSPKTVFITNDFLRDHLVLLNEDAKTKLERYIDTHQVWIENKTLRAIWPTPFEKLPAVDETGSHFHIPVIDYNKIGLLSQHEPPPHLNNKITTWLCCSTSALDDKLVDHGEARQGVPG